MNPELQRLQSRAESCHREVALEYFNAFAGLQDRLDTDAIYARYPELGEESTWRFISELDGSAVADAREHRFLKLAFSGLLAESRYRELNELIANTEGDATVEVDGAQVPFRALPGRISNEPDYARRGELDAKYIGLIASLNPLHAQLEDLIGETVRGLGYSSTPAMVAELRGLDPQRFAQTARDFLDRSDGVYEERLAQYASLVGLSVGAASSRPWDGGRDAAATELRHADMGWVLRAGRFDQLFPPQDMLPALARTLAGLGINLESQRNVTLDLEQRPRKTPRAFCIAIDAPDDVRLVLSPRGGQDDYSVLFHEAGHLEFSAHINPALPYIYKQHGDLSVHEGYAFLFQHLTASPVWWREIMNADPGDYPAFARFQRLYLFRRYCAKLNYELEYYASGGGEEMADVYASWLSRAVGFPYPPQRYLADFDSDLYVLQYLQAWVWEVQLRRHLEQRFGEAWFTQRRAGDLLRELWAEGMKYSAEELAGQLGLGGLETEPLAQELLP